MNVQAILSAGLSRLGAFFSPPARRRFTYLALLLQHTRGIMTAPLALLFYLATLLLSIAAAAAARNAGNRVPLLNQLTIGVYPKRK